MVFDGKDVDPRSTLQMACAESEAWLAAQAFTNAIDKSPDNTTNPPLTTTTDTIFPRCQVDASWVYGKQFFGGGFVLDTGHYSSLQGSFARSQVLSPLHAEFQTLLWAMSTVRQFGYTSMRFETDCLQLTRLIEAEEEWPSLASEFDEFLSLQARFLSFSLSFIPRSNNVRADALSKEARARENTFSHVQPLAPIRVASQATPIEAI
ncbi:unnamed protein product [Microthlaspi erraticum]|uniref:RNase H type-1 domain-containing protein n=1 Tax=Microthlaspi erraticum TaxID=1685480 RepID=A0A6D2IB57_9BRAS|nr:unnamed protein product [Microthlaspi erraticum]